ncbi:MAG: ArsR/SmtB family transcription factor [Acidimicrobiales bacterium]
MAQPITELTDPCCAPPMVGLGLNETDAANLARAFAALADPVRLRLLSLVASQPEVCSCDLEAPLGKSQPTISHHTKALAAAGLIEGQRRGRWVWWRVVPERLEALRASLG